jgi:outer membrane autotransporter protein
VRSGIALGRGQDRSEVGGDTGRVDSRSDSVIAYGSWQAPRGLRVNASLGQSRTLLDTQRAVITGDALQGQRRATQRYGALSGSTRFDLGQWQFTPRAGIEHMRAFVDGYAEDDLSPLALGYDSARLTSSDLHGGLALTRQWKPALWTVEPQLSLDWHRRLQGNVSQTLRYLDDAFGGTSFTLASVEPASEFALVGIGVRLSQSQGWSLSLGARSTLDGSGSALRSTGYTAAVQRPF